MFRMLKLHPPPNGWRAVWWELIIVVLGVLIALAAQQAVETWNWRSAVAVEREVLRAEVRDNLNSVQDRLVLEPCMVRKLEDIRIVLEREAKGQPLEIAGRVGLPLPSGGAKGAWNIALAGQGLAHMPHEEQLGFSNAFSSFENWDRIREDEREAWLDLAVLDRPDTLTDADWVDIRRAYARAAAAHIRIASVGPFIFRSAGMGQRPYSEATARERLKKARYGSELCEPLIRPVAG